MCGLLSLCQTELHVTIEEVALAVGAQDRIFISLGLVASHCTFETRELEVTWQLCVGLSLVAEGGGTLGDH